MDLTGLQGLQAGTSIALDLDQRPMPRGPLFPRFVLLDCRHIFAHCAGAGDGDGEHDVRRGRRELHDVFLYILFYTDCGLVKDSHGFCCTIVASNELLRYLVSLTLIDFLCQPFPSSLVQVLAAN